MPTEGATNNTLNFDDIQCSFQFYASCWWITLTSVSRIIRVHFDINILFKNDSRLLLFASELYYLFRHTHHFAARCDRRTAPDNGSVSKPKNRRYFVIGEKVSFRCKEGFRLEGSDTDTCGKDGEWVINKTPSCEKSKSAVLHILSAVSLSMVIMVIRLVTLSSSCYFCCLYNETI